MRSVTLLLLAAAERASGSGSLTFFATADWGGDTDSDPTWPGEKKTAVGMSKVAAAGGGVDFIMGVGDNFYDSGIDDGKGADSPRFKQTWEDVYMNKKALQVPWYLVAGNHDHNGDVNAQIDYSKKNQYWNFPSMWYSFSKSFTGASGKNITTQIIYLDTVDLAGMSQKYRNGTMVEGQPHPIQERFPPSQQLDWFKKTIAASTADYLWVSGHYPVYSICEHGNTQEIISDVLPLLKQYKATGYISGHDHCQEQFEVDGMALVVSGAGAECCYSPSNKNGVPKGSLLFHMDSKNNYGMTENNGGGFASFTATETSTVMKHYDMNGKVLYTSPGYKPRSL